MLKIHAALKLTLLYGYLIQYESIQVPYPVDKSNMISKIEEDEKTAVSTALNNLRHSRTKCDTFFKQF